MSAWGCCGAYNDHAPDCITIKYEELKRQNEVLLEAVEFYANDLNWNPSDSDSASIKDMITVSDVRTLGIEQFEDRYGGKRAREALAQVRGGNGSKNGSIESDEMNGGILI